MLITSPAIELLKLSGFSPIITTASPRNADFLLHTVGATHVLDRNLSPDALQAEIRKITDKPITTIYDAAGTPETQVLGYDLLASGGTLASVQPQPIPPEKVVPDKKAFFMFGDLGLPQNRKLGASLYSKLTELLAEGALKVRCGLLLLACMYAWDCGADDVSRSQRRSRSYREVWARCRLLWRDSARGSAA